MLAAASSNDVAPGALGFLVVFGMAVVLFFLFRSMSRHLRRVNAPSRKDQDAGSGSPEDRGDDDGTASASSGAPRPGDRHRDS